MHCAKAFTSVAADCSAPGDPALHIWKLSWNPGELWVAMQDQNSSHSDLLEVWRQAAQFVVIQEQTASHCQVAEAPRKKFQLIASQAQNSSAQDCSKGLWKFSNLAEGQVPVRQQSIGIEGAALEHSVPVCVRIQGHELLHQHLGCLV